MPGKCAEHLNMARPPDNVAFQAQRDVYKAQLQKCQDIITHLKNVMFLMQKIQAKTTLL